MEILDKNNRIKVSEGFVNLLAAWPLSRVLLKFYPHEYRQKYDIAVNGFKTFEENYIKAGLNNRFPFITMKEWKKHFFYCAINYGADVMDYLHMEMYNKSDLALNSYVTTFHQWHDIVPLINSDYYGESTKVLRDKDAFADKFGDLLGRKYMVLNSKVSYSQFENFLSTLDKVVVKPRSASFQGNGVYIVPKEEFATKQQRQELYEELKLKDVMLEEFLCQTGILHDLNPMTVNTARIVTFNIHGRIEILFATLKMGNGNTFVDNICKGGMKTPINLEYGIISGPALDENNNEYLIHPFSGITIIGQKIPNWEKTLDTVKEAARRLPEVPFIGWDVAIGENGVFLIEGNQGSSIQDFEYAWEDGYYEQIQKYAVELTGRNF